MKNASFTPTVSSLLSPSVRAFFWHDASSVGSWETWNILTSLCQSPPASQDEALWWLRWQWQTDNEWMRHFTPLTSFWNGIFFFFLPPPNCPLSRRATAGGQRLTEGNNFQPSKDFLHGDTWVILMDTSPKLSRVRSCLSVCQTFLGSLPLLHNHSYWKRK